jgi:HAD superfamily hydrolase (TIGR01490 family)
MWMLRAIKRSQLELDQPPIQPRQTLKPTQLTIFDLDHTLIPLDSEMEWLRFLAASGAIGQPQQVASQMQAFEERFAQGQMSDSEYSDYVYGLQRGLPVAQAEKLREQFAQDHVKPHITESARALVNRHQQAGDLVVLITGSSAFMTAPIVAELNILHGLGTQSRIENGVFTGDVLGVPTFGHGKIKSLNAFLQQRNQRFEDFAHSTFYSDSTYDLPLLEHVKEPIATNPKPALKAIADARGWQTLHLW